MTLDAVRLGYARMTMQVKKNMANGQKVCHGGFIFTLADSAFGFACNTHNQRAVSASCSIGYLAPAFSIRRAKRWRCSVAIARR